MQTISMLALHVIYIGQTACLVVTQCDGQVELMCCKAASCSGDSQSFTLM